MRDVLDSVARWRADGKRVALATVVSTWGSAPRQPGAVMAISAERELAGSVSGGCVEGAVVEAAGEVLAGGEPRLLHFGVSDEDAWAVGLSCGGKIDVFVEPLWDRPRTAETSSTGRSVPSAEAGGREADTRFELYRQLEQALAADELLAQATVVSGPATGAGMLLWPDGRTVGGLASEVLESHAAETAAELFPVFGSRRAAVEVDGDEVDLFVHVHAPRPQLVIVGGGHVSEHLVRLAAELGFHTVVIDPRAPFATPERFSAADRLIQEWPGAAFEELDVHEATSVAVLSHDLKLDVPALQAVLASRARYVGALGSRKTQARRAAALREAGVAEEGIARIRSPIGLDLGGRRPDEIALAVLAEIVATRHGKGPGG